MLQSMGAAAGAVLLVAIGSGCTPKRGIEMKYERTGGIVGARDEILVDADGSMTTRGRVIGSRRGRLDEEQRSELARLVEGWGQLDAPTPVQRGADYFTHTVTHAGRTLTWTDLSTDVAPQLRELARRLEAMARTIAPTRADKPPR